MDNFIFYLCVIVTVYAIEVVARRVVFYIEGQIATRRAAKQSDAILCRNLQYSKKRHIIGLFFSILMVYVWSSCADLFWSQEDIWVIILWGMAGVVWALNIMIDLAGIFQSEYAYLTEDGIMASYDVMKWEKCTFSWEQRGQEKLPVIVQVYPGKEKNPHRFQILSHVERAHEIIDKRMQ